ncbi:hypothetical protein OFAG_00955 [Oxalobacter formigenes HOxBLS]|uniref:Uncharacterized protein n=1 Tax=Oxalobacter paraformigenes TaxID=556268 RepID=C3X3L6_9BURK|nr:hypothetical protein OFAG_00955 [Oxalobacter paraformigenes]
MESWFTGVFQAKGEQDFIISEAVRNKLFFYKSLQTIHFFRIGQTGRRAFLPACPAGFVRKTRETDGDARHGSGVAGRRVCGESGSLITPGEPVGESGGSGALSGRRHACPPGSGAAASGFGVCRKRAHGKTGRTRIAREGRTGSGRGLIAGRLPLPESLRRFAFAGCFRKSPMHVWGFFRLSAVFRIVPMAAVSGNGRLASGRKPAGAGRRKKGFCRVLRPVLLAVLPGHFFFRGFGGAFFFSPNRIFQRK